MKTVVFIQKIGEVDTSILIRLKKNLSWLFKKFALKVEIIPNAYSIQGDEYLEAERHYDGELILNRLENNFKSTIKNKLLGIIDADIKGIRKIHLFGLSNLRSSCALISIDRLRGSFCNGYEDQALFELRILKEATHELGHTFGLDHCTNECVMKYSNNLEDVDKKPKDFCQVCFQALKKSIKTRN
ncbi:MAG: hypothetical protein EU531_01550 [Promethearchaeota archaeon]|nr:MAG: hypothetical protein EU531_01550 [Candidatus Lokiarchaeota archaeon]